MLTIIKLSIILYALETFDFVNKNIIQVILNAKNKSGNKYQKIIFVQAENLRLDFL